MADLVESMVRNADTVQSWHNKETTIPADAPFDAWFDASGLNYKVLRSVVAYTAEDERYEMPSRHVLFRGDTLAPLAVVGEDYHIVQPREVLEFYRNLCDENKLIMDTAGVLAGGKRVWALARTGLEATVGNADIIKQYVLLATSYDTSMATIAKHTSVRVVCNNTLSVAYGNGEAAIRVLHSSKFDAKSAQLDLGLMDESFADFADYADDMTKVRYEPTTAARWYAELLKDRPVTDIEMADMMDNRVLRGLMKSYAGAPGAEATLWGIVNGVTHMVDHVRGRSYDTRMNAAWFGAGASLKAQAWDKAKQIIDGVYEKVVADAEVTT